MYRSSAAASVLLDGRGLRLRNGLQVAPRVADCPVARALRVERVTFGVGRERATRGSGGPSKAYVRRVRFHSAADPQRGAS
jgi:hypothetical protein